MRVYTGRDKAMIMQAMESDILALIVIDTNTDDFQVVYSDGGYRDFGEAHRGVKFFDMWASIGVSLMPEEDRKRMASEISKDALLFALEKADTYSTICRFGRKRDETYCLVRVKKDVIEPDTLVISIRNVDREIRHAKERLLDRQQRERDMAQMEESLRRMKMKTLIDMMHPHFLYNALSSIREIVLTDPEYGADLIYDFTTHLRAGIRAATGDDLIDFGQEMENIRAFINIEMMRFAGRLKVEYDIETEDFKVPPLTVQPLVENAIRHGIYEGAAGEGVVRLSARRKGSDIIVQVSDNGAGFDTGKLKEDIFEGSSGSTGIYNAVFRLENMASARVDIDSAPGAGTTITVTLPQKR